VFVCNRTYLRSTEPAAPGEFGGGEEDMCGDLGGYSFDVFAFRPPLPARLVKSLYKIPLGSLGIEAHAVHAFQLHSNITLLNPCRQIKVRSGSLR
jgi:hypothetical protein